MDKSYRPLSVAECKVQASILLKSLYSQDKDQAKRAAKRLQKLPTFACYSLAEIIEQPIKYKAALQVIALEKGFSSWAELKFQLPLIQGGFLNKWFASYSEAKAHHQINGGYLLPYRKQFFICDADYIVSLGLNPSDPDWQSIEYDWVNPSDKKAECSLYKKWLQIQSPNHQ